MSKYDASFFSMTSAEAAGTDPQQRILLEVTYEAFENGNAPQDPHDDGPILIKQ